MALAERLNKTITHSMLSLRQIDLKISAVQTLVKGLQCMLNKRALSMVNGEPITPNMLLTGFDIDMQPDYTQSRVAKKCIKARADIQAQTKKMKTLNSRVWSKFILTYVEGLNCYKKRYAQANDIKEGDYVLYSGYNRELSPINTYMICKVLEAKRGRDGDSVIRSLKVKLVKGGKPRVFVRPIRRFSLLELDGIKAEASYLAPTNKS